MSNKTKRLIYVYMFVLAILIPCSYGEEQQNTSFRTIEFETSEVTQADVTVSPDGRTLVFSMLGHLFKLPIEGGTAEQLTFGPYYDTNPVFSPNGTQIAFSSDRDGSESNIFILEINSQQITQITHDNWAVRPTWCPDNQEIVYLEFIAGTEQTSHGPVSAHIRQVNLLTGEHRTISPNPRCFRSLFYLSDGRLGWAVLDGRFNSWSRRGSRNVKTHGLSSSLPASPSRPGLVPCPATKGPYPFGIPRRLCVIQSRLVRYYGLYSNAHRGKIRKNMASPSHPPIIEQEEPFVPSKGWTEMIRKVYELDPLRCPSCGGQMRIISFIEDPKSIDKIIRHLKLSFQAERPPPSYVASQELLMAAEEQGEYF